jgi:hypothetical protein
MEKTDLISRVVEIDDALSTQDVGGHESVGVR